MLFFDDVEQEDPANTDFFCVLLSAQKSVCVPHTWLCGLVVPPGRSKLICTGCHSRGLRLLLGLLVSYR